MAQDIFLKIDGVQGESLDSNHKDEIEVISWNWKMQQLSTMHSGSGGGSGKAEVDDLIFEHYIDRASPNLMKMCLTGKHMKQAILTVRKAGGTPVEYLKITMDDVIVTRVAPSGSSTDENRIREQVGLSFSKVQQEYTVQNKEGGSGGTVTTGYNLKENREA